VTGAVAADAVAVVLMGLLAGCYVDGSLVVAPAGRRLPASTWVRVEQATTAVGSVRYRVLLATVVIADLAALTLDDPTVTAVSLHVGGLVLVVATTILVTVRRVVPINALVHTWSADDPPSAWHEVRDRWRHLHHGRTVGMVLAFVVQVVALVTR
jgi:hypothetical protein